MVPVSVRVPVLVLELTVVLGHKSDLFICVFVLEIPVFRTLIDH